MKHFQIKQSITDRSTDSVRMYLKDISKYPLLTAEQERELAVKTINGDKQAKDKLVESNLRFVVSIAKQYQGKGLELEDLISSGNLGLIRATELFEPERELRFLSYAGWWIRDFIINEIMNNGKEIRIPFNKAITINKINQALLDFETRNERPPTADEVAELLEMEEDSVKELMGMTDLSIVKDLSEVDASYTPEININQEFLIHFLQANLSRMEAQILCESFGIGTEEKDIKQIADERNLTIERVRQIKNTAILKLRKHPNINNLLNYF